MSAMLMFNQGERDYANLPSHIPTVRLNLPVRHMGTYSDTNGGEFANAAIQFSDWHRKGNLLKEMGWLSGRAVVDAQG